MGLKGAKSNGEKVLDGAKRLVLLLRLVKILVSGKLRDAGDEVAGSRLSGEEAFSGSLYAGVYASDFSSRILDKRASMMSDVLSIDRPRSSLPYVASALVAT
jgi:hypothetical protein